MPRSDSRSVQPPNALAPAPGEADRVRRAVAGDPDAFAGLYDAYHRRILRFVAARVDDPATAEDLTAHVFMKAWDRLDGYRPGESPFGAWLFKIARNSVIDHYRTSRPTAPLELAGLETESGEADPLETLRVRAALGRLTDDQREVLMLRFYDGMSTEEIGKQIGKRTGAVRALQLRGLRALADLLGAESV